LVRKTVKSSVNVAANAASAHTQASQPTDLSFAHVSPPRPSRRSSPAKNVNATKPVMYIVSFVAKPAAISAPTTAGCQNRGASRKRKTTTNSARLIAAK
jgi:hypothetical protein